ncbi:MAG: phosphatidylserine synthase [Verrucomicrobiae bacterium]|nr:phosphatidylserine synthase [Verrucomicrobiae bacterium]
MQLILNQAHYEVLLRETIPSARRFVWIATADLKDLHVAGPGKKFRPFLADLADLVEAGVDVRLIHAKEPGPRFRKDFDRYPALIESDRFERVLCPRMHAKIVIVDGEAAYVGSANLTGAGIGAKSANRRNFEAGFLTRDPDTVGELMEFLDALWIGDHCLKCGRRDVCPDPIA